MGFSEKDEAIILQRLGKSLTKRQKQLLGLLPKEKDDERCPSVPPFKVNGRLKYGRIICLRRMPDGSLWNSITEGAEPPREV